MFIYIQDLLLQTLHFKISLCLLSHKLSLLLYKVVSFYILRIVNRYKYFWLLYANVSVNIKYNNQTKGFI